MVHRIVKSLRGWWRIFFIATVLAVVCFMLSVCVGGYLALIDPNPIDTMFGKDTVFECCNGRFEVLKHHNPDRLYLYDNATGEVVLENVTSYSRQGNQVIVRSVSKQVEIDCSTGSISIYDR
jgi:hypothetical protein